MSVDDYGIETLKKAAEEITPGDKSEYQYKVRVTESALPDGASTEAKQDLEIAQLTAINANTDTIEAILTELDTNTDEIEAKLDTGNASLASIDLDIDIALSTRASEASLVAFESANHTDILGVQTRLDTIHSDVDGVETLITATNVKLDSIITQTTAINANTDTVESLIGTTNTEIGGLTETAPASDTASSGLNGRLQRVAQNITVSNTKLDSIITQTTAINTNTASIDSKIIDNFGVVSAGVRTASIPGNVAGIADFNAGTTGAQTPRNTSNITRNGTELSYNSGTSDANTLRTASNLKREGNDLNYDYGTVGANTPRTAAEIGNATGAADFNAGTTGAQTQRVTANITRNGTELSYNGGSSDANTQRVASNLYDGSGNALTSQLNGSSQRGLHVEVLDGPQLDSYSRHRVSSPNVLFSGYFSNTAHPLLLNTAIVGTASIAYNSTIGCARLSTSTGATDSIIAQTKKYLRYNPGVSYSIAISGVIGAAKSNVRKRWGYFDTNDGLFFEQTSTGIGVVTRTSTSGSIVDTRVDQVNWNIDPMTGSGPSGITLDPSKHNLYVIDFVWQGAGRVRFGIMVGGKIQYVHQITNSNNLTTAFMKSPSRPGRVELTNTGVATATTVDVVCFTAVRESTDEPQPTYNFTASNGVANKTANSTTVQVPVLSIRPRATFNGITNRVPIQPSDIEILSVQDTCLVSVFLNATLTGASFTAFDSTNSAAEFDTSATAISGGTKIDQFYVPGGGKGLALLQDLSDLLTLGLDIAGSTADVITVSALKTAANTDVYATISWDEFQ